MGQSVFPGVGAAATTSRWGWVTVIQGWAAVSGLALLALALAEAPFLGAAPLPVVMAVLLPSSVILAGAAVVLERLAGVSWARLGAAWTPRILGGFLAFTIFFVGSAFSNTLLVDGPTEHEIAAEDLHRFTNGSPDDRLA